jgi:hypothetical protein
MRHRSGEVNENIHHAQFLYAASLDWAAKSNSSTGISPFADRCPDSTLELPKFSGVLVDALGAVDGPVDGEHFSSAAAGRPVGLSSLFTKSAFGASASLAILSPNGGYSSAKQLIAQTPPGVSGFVVAISIA